MKNGLYQRAFRISRRVCCAGLASVVIPSAVWAANQAPVILPVPAMTVYVKEPVRFALDASDPDNTPLTYSLSGLPAGAAIGASTGWFSWDPAMADTGAHTATFTVSDGVASVSTTVVVAVVMPKLGAGQYTRVLRPNGGETYRYGDTLNVAFVTLSCSDEGQVIVQYGNYFRSNWLYTAQNTDRLELDGSPIDARGVACRYFYSFAGLGVNVGFYRLALRDTSLMNTRGRICSFGGDSVVVDSLKIKINDPYGDVGMCADPAQGAGVLTGDASDNFFRVMPRSAALSTAFQRKPRSGFCDSPYHVVTRGRLFSMPGDRPSQMRLFDMKGVLVREIRDAQGVADLSGIPCGYYTGRVDQDGHVKNVRIMLH